jgi:hypothetical protein
LLAANFAIFDGVSTVFGQGIGLATGLQDKFSWASVAAAGVSAQFGKFVDKRLQLKPLSGAGADYSPGNIAEHLASGGVPSENSISTRFPEIAPAAEHGA